MHWDFNVILGKQKTPGAIHNLNQSTIWIALGVFCFPWGKQKTPGGISPGVFCFPRIIKTPNNRIFISVWVINGKMRMLFPWPKNQQTNWHHVKERHSTPSGTRKYLKNRKCEHSYIHYSKEQFIIYSERRSFPDGYSIPYVNEVTLRRQKPPL